MQGKDTIVPRESFDLSTGAGSHRLRETPGREGRLELRFFPSGPSPRRRPTIRLTHGTRQKPCLNFSSVVVPIVAEVLR